MVVIPALRASCHDWRGGEADCIVTFFFVAAAVSVLE